MNLAATGLTAITPEFVTLLGPVFAAGMLVLASHVPLGRAVLARGIVFLDLAIAQMAGLGVVLAHHIAGESAGFWPVQLGAMAAALLGALLLHTCERRAGARQEAVIGVAFAVAACLSLLFMSHDLHGAERLQDLLVGQIVWTRWHDLPALAAVAALVWAARRVVQQGGAGFYALFALGITVSVQVVGVYLVFASLIVPALAARGRMGAAWGVGAAGYALGLAASLYFDLPAGAAIVVALALCAVVWQFVFFRNTEGE